MEPPFFDDSMRAARAATVGASKISLNEKSTPKRCPQTRKHLRHRQGIGTECENVLIDADFSKLQQVRPHFGQLRLQFRAGWRRLRRFSRDRWRRYRKHMRPVRLS